MIEIKNLNKYFNKGKKNEIHVINNVTLTLDNNGLVALLGPSGSGKTTLLNTIGGLDNVKSGSIYVNGEKITSKFISKRDEIRNLNIGYIFQDYKLIDNLSVFDNVALVLKMIGIKDKKEITTRVNYVLEKLGMYRYRNRPAGMLSGGERQRVGIARAIVKDPDIIIADEPTGNLDSKNSLEIMNIIKSISKDRLVILVTHENNLAKFYASRIIEIEDGTIIKDYENSHSNVLDYQIENRFYLKDFKNYESIKEKSIDVDVYSDGEAKIKLDIILKNGNIYIKSNTKEKVEVIDDNSSIELIDDHYKEIDRETVDKYEFNFGDVINRNIKKKYSSVFNIFTFIASGFKKVFDFPILKKILLIGFFLSGIFIMASISTIAGTLKIEDKDFITYNKNYLMIETNAMNVSDYLEYEKIDSVNYLLPSDSIVSFNLKIDDYYQTDYYFYQLKGSLSSVDMIDESDLIWGRMIENDYEIIVDKMVIDNLLNSSQQQIKMSGITKMDDVINRKFTLNNMDEFTIVGVTDLDNPTIYAKNNMLINMINNSRTDIETGMYDSSESSVSGFDDYKLFEQEIKLLKGRMPSGDYEIIVNIIHENEMPLNKEISTKIGDRNLKVVGYYDSSNNIDKYLVNENTVKYALVRTTSNIVVYSDEKESALKDFRDLKLNINDTYEYSKNNYISGQKDMIVNNLIVSGIILVISLVEILLMIRASFLSRIKEIGVLRAIGVKRIDIYKMFMGEIIAITTIASVPGILFMAYIFSVLSTISMIADSFVINWIVVLFAMLLVYLFNLLVGLIPVFNTVRKTPAQILSRHDLD